MKWFAVKIAFDHEIFCLQKRGGISRYFCCLADEYIKHGHEVSTFAAFHVNDSLDSCTSISVRGRKVESYPPKLGGLSVKYNEWQGARDIRQWRPNVVHKTFYSPLDGSSYKAPLVVTVHDMIHELFPEEFRAKDNTQKLKREAVKSADHVICISENTKKDLLKFVDINEHKISVIYHGVGLQDVSRIAPKSTGQMTKNRPVVLYVGARNKYKNFTALIKGIGVNHRVRDSVELVAFGGGAFTNHELQLFHQYGINNFRQETGNDEKLIWYYQNSAVFVYPSLYEGFGFPPLEAMALGCPVIASNASVLPEILGDGCLYFDPENPEQLANAAEEVLFGRAKRDQLIVAGYAQSSKYSWQHTAEKTLKVYESLQ